MEGKKKKECLKSLLIFPDLWLFQGLLVPTKNCRPQSSACTTASAVASVTMIKSRNPEIIPLYASYRLYKLSPFRALFQFLSIQEFWPFQLHPFMGGKTISHARPPFANLSIGPIVHVRAAPTHSQSLYGALSALVCYHHIRQEHL